MAASSKAWACVLAAAILCATRPASASDPRYPDWPCPQLKAPGISVAAVWTGPAIDSIDRTQLSDPGDADLVTRLAARRTPMDEAQKLIQRYVAREEADKQVKATALFAQLYSVLDAQRGEVMNGIDRFSRKEKDMAAEIRAKTHKLQEMQDGPDADQAAIDELSKQVEWETRIFEDRRKSLTYVCEVPVLIEKRLFDLARVIQDAANLDPAAR